MKSISGLWISPNTDATNASCFSGLPGGGRSTIGVFESVGNAGAWWSSTENNSYTAWMHSLFYFSPALGWGNDFKDSGLSVRCLRDE